MDDNTAPPRDKLAEIFGRMNLGELPAISSHVHELLALTGSQRATTEGVAQAVLKDFSLTNKVLQVVNSAYYQRGVPITTIERAVAALGINTIRELAVTISLVEEFLKTGIEKEGISKLLAVSYLSAHLSKTLAHCKRLPVLPEEAYICSMLHDLGRIIIFIYMPDVYRRIDLAQSHGSSEEAMAELLLKGLTYADIGMAIGRFWNFADPLVDAMATNPPPLVDKSDNRLWLQHLALFSNRFTRSVSEEKGVTAIITQYGEPFRICCREPLEILFRLCDTATSISEPINYGLTRLRMRSRLLHALNACKNPVAA